MMRVFFGKPVTDVLACLERLVAGPKPQKSLVVMLAGLIISWIVYVPVHELLHAAGCVLAGGTISRLEIDPLYGGAILARVFPFVVSGSEYAGRLSGFDTRGSDLVYLATDFTPFLLSVVLGVPLLRLCMRRRRPMLFGTACVIGLAPFYNIIGDYNEMGSIIVTHALASASGQRIEHPTIEESVDEISVPKDSAAAVAGSPTSSSEGRQPVFDKENSRGDAASALPTSIAWSRLRSDDVFKRIGSVFKRPGEFGIQSAFQAVLALLVVLIGFSVGILLAFATYFLGHCFARLTVKVGKS